MLSRAALANGLAASVASLVLLLALRNSLTWQLALFWGRAGDEWQRLWDSFLDVVSGEGRERKEELGEDGIFLSRTTKLLTFMNLSFPIRDLLLTCI